MSPPEKRPVPPQRPVVPAQQPKPVPQQTAPPPAPQVPPSVMTEEDVQLCEQMSEAFVNARDRLGRTERQWHIAAVEFYKLEAEMAKTDAYIRSTYALGPMDEFDPGSGRILRRGHRHMHQPQQQ